MLNDKEIEYSVLKRICPVILKDMKPGSMEYVETLMDIFGTPIRQKLDSFTNHQLYLSFVDLAYDYVCIYNIINDLSDIERKNLEDNYIRLGYVNDITKQLSWDNINEVLKFIIRDDDAIEDCLRIIVDLLDKDENEEADCSDSFVIGEYDGEEKQCYASVVDYDSVNIQITHPSKKGHVFMYISEMGKDSITFSTHSEYTDKEDILKISKLDATENISIRIVFKTLMGNLFARKIGLLK